MLSRAQLYSTYKTFLVSFAGKLLKEERPSLLIAESPEPRIVQTHSVHAWNFSEGSAGMGRAREPARAGSALGHGSVGPELLGTERGDQGGG